MSLSTGFEILCIEEGAGEQFKQRCCLQQANEMKRFKFTQAHQNWIIGNRTAMAGSDVVQSGRPIFDDFFQHLWPCIGNNTANVVFQMVKRLWLIRIDQ
ncbi:hypothetical protein TNCV_4917841 [Trichonephila clavipes]|nr:hypothetical protein TNCV_4917841 [Trichonephila clavipes]